jgi:hypothetical protein
MIVGFTGTRKGMTEAQIQQVRSILSSIQHLGDPPFIVGLKLGRHGDCVGADAQFHEILVSLDVEIAIHPPTDPKHRAFCTGSRVTLFPEKPYIARNHDIVNLSEIMIGAPKEEHEPKSKIGGGTWATIRFAAKQNRILYVVRPSGKIVAHNL